MFIKNLGHVKIYASKLINGFVICFLAKDPVYSRLISKSSKDKKNHIYNGPLHTKSWIERKFT